VEGIVCVRPLLVMMLVLMVVVMMMMGRWGMGERVDRGMWWV